MKIALNILHALCLRATATRIAMALTQPHAAPAAARPGALPTSAASSAGTAPAAKPAAAAAGAASSNGGAPVPLLWKVSDADNAVYLLGSFHALKPTDYPVAPAIDAAFKDAKLVAFEVPPEEMTSPELGMQMMQAAMQPQGGSLQSAIDPATYARVQAWCEKRGVAIEGMDVLEPWMVALIIQMTDMGRVGYDPEQGLDQQLIKRAGADGKRTMGLETGASQIAVLDGMSAEEQKQSLTEALDDSENQHELDQLHDQWRRGDVAALEAKLTVEFRKSYPSLYQRIDVDRNNAWVPKIRELLDGPGHDDAMVVVGTMHLLGPDGVVSQLQSKGYRVQRVQ
jgi:uncharacterized protein YbaP (TraB family)